MKWITREHPRIDCIRRLLLPRGVEEFALPLLMGKALRAFADGYVAVLLPAYLLALGFGTMDVGILSTVTLLGSAFATLAIGAWGYRFHHRSLLLGAALLMMSTGFAFAMQTAFWPLLLIAFVGTLNPSSGDVSVFLPLEHARLAEAGQGDARTSLFARYSLLGALFAAFGALAAAIPEWLAAQSGISPLVCFPGHVHPLWIDRWRSLAALRRLPQPTAEAPLPPIPLGPSRGIVIKLAALFSVDAFAGGLVINSLMTLWLFQRFDVSLADAGIFFFWVGILSAASQLAAPWVAQRIGLLNTMVFTHIPSNLCLILAAMAPSSELAVGLLFVRALLSQMDVPTRSAFVMNVVTPAERAAAASFTSVPRSLASAISPTLGGAMFAAGWLAAPLVACGVLKVTYDLVLWRAFKKHSGKS